jgi:hypothetical protein
MKMIRHSARIAATVFLIVLIMIYPFLPGQYDPSALPLSTIVQLLATVGLLLVPLGFLWLVYELRKRVRRNRNLPNVNRGYSFALVSLIAASILISLISLFATFGIGVSFGVLTFLFGFYAGSRLIPGLKRLKKAETENVNPAPFYLILIPVVVLFFQLTLAAPLTEFSRNHAIAKSNEFIGDIEAYHNEYGDYPVSLVAMWKDYYPDVVGVEKYHYLPYGQSYNLFFEQPRFLLDNLGTREWVVYNPDDDQRVYSHTAWFLLLTPEELERSQGWYAAHDTVFPHWKYFWFD